MQISRARKLLQKDRDLVFWIFGERCVKCGKKTTIIHEIYPISHGKKSLVLKNRVPVCMNCHEWAHRVGTNNSIPILLELRHKALIRRFGLDG
jgi:5-methylcytosine-specific restriction endonuclease McrA